MEIVLLLARLLLAGVFAVAGIAKLVDREGSRRAVAGFGVPASIAAPIGVLLPFAELAVAVTLIPASTALLGAVGALVLLLLFCAGIGVNLARGRRPDCHCFGQLHSAPAGPSTLARNGALAVVAAFLVWQGAGGRVGPSVFGWIEDLSGFQTVALMGGVILLALVGAQWLFLIGLLKQNGRLLARLNALEAGFVEAGVEPAPSANGGYPEGGLPVGSPAPMFTLDDIRGGKTTLDDLRARGKPVALLFTDPNCEPCMELMPDIGRWQREHADELTISIVGRGTIEENSAETSEHGVENVLLQEDWEVADAYEVDATPGAVMVSPEGAIGSPVVSGPDGVEALVAQAVGEPVSVPTAGSPSAGQDGHDHEETDGPGVGELAPEFRLPDLEGKLVGLEDFRGEETLLLFCSPDCGYCQEMMPDLREWERTARAGDPRLLVVSEGTAEENAPMGVRAPIVLEDDSYEVSEAYGVDGTPSAVLVDAEGRIASKMALGSGEVLDLLGFD